MDDQEAALLAANEGFYQAFRTHDVAAMDDLWAREVPVAVIHPGWPPLHGRSAVMQSWRSILEAPSPPEIQASAAQVYLLGETAFVICSEHLPEGSLIATNVFVRESGSWRLVHHQAGQGPEEEDEAPDTGGVLH